MTIPVYIDSCAWNYLYENGIDLKKELAPSRFSVRITREVEIELSAIPDTGCDGADKRALKDYIKKNIHKQPVVTSSVFGFASVERDGTPSPVQIYGGFDQGTWQSRDEHDFYSRPEIQLQLQKGKKANSGLDKNQTDASLAAKSLTGFVLTTEGKSKTGPLKVAADLGKKVVYLSDKPSGLSIGDYLLELAPRLPFTA